MSRRLVAGRYRLHSVLGRGGMAVVWRAVDERLSRPVAVKVLDNRDPADPAAVQRLDQEARAIARLTHPNVVAVHDVGIDDDTPYLVMELVDGQSLAALLAAGPMPIDETVNMAIQVCDALHAAHAAGVVHRDVKPGNIMVTAAGAVKVCDFGIAHLPQATQASLTGAAMAVGTSDYMAPERATGGPVDARSDLYALGCVLYAMLAGRPPFHGDDPLGVLWQHVHQPVVPVASLRPDVPAALDALIGHLLAKNPEDRPANAAEVRDRLAHLSGQPMPPLIENSHPAAVTAAARPVRAQAAVLSPTQTMPVLDIDAQPHAAPDRFRLGPAGIAAVAVGAAVIAAVAVALLVSGQPGPQTAPNPPASTIASVPATAGQTDTPAAAIAAVEAAIQAQMLNGALDPDAGRALSEQADEVAREVAKGRTEKAAEKAADLREKLGELRQDGKLSSAGYDAILGSLDRLISALPPAGRGDD